MARKIFIKKRFPQRDFIYDHLLVSLLISRILKKGKKRLAKRIFSLTLQLIELKTEQNPISLVEKAIRNISPRVQLKSKRLRGATVQIPTAITRFRSTKIAVCWIVDLARKRSGKAMAVKLASEFLEAAKGVGNAIRKKEETHKMAESNKAFAR